MENSKRAYAIERMIKINKMHRGMVEQRTKDIGMHRTQHRILMHLARDGQLPSQRELADRLDITPAAVTVALRKIEQDGYVERTLGHDARYNELKITQKGRVLVDRTHAIFQEIDAAVFDGFSDEELNLYISCLEKIQWNMQQNATV